MNFKLLIGSHVSMSKASNYYLGAIQKTLANGANSLMIYTSSPQSTKRVELSQMQIKEGFELVKISNLNTKNFVVHAPYIINLATNKPNNYNFAIQFLIEEVFRTQAMGINKLVLHPGSYVNQTYDEAIKLLSTALLKVLDATAQSEVIICLETMAGKGCEIGRTFEELAQLIQLCNYHPRLGVCLDTCHIHDAGYDLKQKNTVLEQFDQTIGLNRLQVIHINDSSNPQGSKKDRHANIGYGYIGFDVLIDWIYDLRLIKIPKILETPYYELASENNLTNVQSYPPYKEEIELIKGRVWKLKFPPNSKLVFDKNFVKTTLFTK